MIKLREFLKLANDPVIVREGTVDVIRIDDRFLDVDLLSEKLLNSEVILVESCDKNIVVILKEELKWLN